MNKYSMADSSKIGDRAIADITKWLRSRKDFIALDTVEDDPEYQVKDIDLLVTRNIDGADEMFSVEVKGDTYYATGNYFFETVSNTSKNSPGCFMYTEADYLFYYFVDQKELHIMKMAEVRPWFIQNIESFKERSTSTAVANGGTYKTIGKLVPRTMVPGVVVVKL